MSEMSAERERPVQTTDLVRWKQQSKRFAMVTAYDYTFGALLDQAGIPVLLVGDSMGGVVLGFQLRDGGPDTVPVTLDDITRSAAAVARGVRHALVVGDLPFLSYHLGVEEATRSAGRLLQEGHVQAVKLEGGGQTLQVVEHLVARGIPVMGHLGLTPQRVHAMGGPRVQGRDQAGAQRIRDDLRGLEGAGAFAVVLEGVPATLAEELTAACAIPTIGIGAGPGCDGQVLVLHDLLGLTIGPVPKFVRQFAALGPQVSEAARQFRAAVEAGEYPDLDHSYR